MRKMQDAREKEEEEEEEGWGGNAKTTCQTGFALILPQLAFEEFTHCSFVYILVQQVRGVLRFPTKSPT